MKTNKLLIGFIIFAVLSVAATAWFLLGAMDDNRFIENDTPAETTPSPQVVEFFDNEFQQPKEDDPMMNQTPNDDPGVYFQGQMSPPPQGYGGYNNMQPPPPPEGFGGGMMGGPGMNNGSSIQIGIRYGTKDAGCTVTGMTQQKLYVTVDKETATDAYVAIIPKVDDTELIDLNDIEDYAYDDEIVKSNGETAVTFDLTKLVGTDGQYRLVMFPRNTSTSGKKPFYGYGWGSEYICVDFSIGVQIR